MNIIPQTLLEKLKQNKDFHIGALDIESKLEKIVSGQPPIFFPQYTDHGINHFADTLSMALQLIDFDVNEKGKDMPLLDLLSDLNILVLVYSTLLHDLGMHIHFKGFKQLINGDFDNVRVEFFD